MDDRAALLALPKEQLVDIILAQPETIARLEAVAVRHTARVAEREAKIDELTRPPATLNILSLPTSAQGSTGASVRGFKPNRAERRAPQARALAWSPGPFVPAAATSLHRLSSQFDRMRVS